MAGTITISAAITLVTGNPSTFAVSNQQLLQRGGSFLEGVVLGAGTTLGTSGIPTLPGAGWLLVQNLSSFQMSLSFITDATTPADGVGNLLWGSVGGNVTGNATASAALSCVAVPGPLASITIQPSMTLPAQTFADCALQASGTLVGPYGTPGSTASLVSDFQPATTGYLLVQNLSVNCYLNGIPPQGVVLLPTVVPYVDSDYLRYLWIAA